MEADGRLHVGERFVVGVSLSDDHSLDAQRVGHISIWMLLDDDFQVSHPTSNPTTFWNPLGSLFPRSARLPVNSAHSEGFRFRYRWPARTIRCALGGSGVTAIRFS